MSPYSDGGCANGLDVAWPRKVGGVDEVLPMSSS